MTTTRPAFEVIAKRRKGFPSETRVKRGLRFVRGGEKELVEKLGRNDPCPCGSGTRFQTLLHAIGPVSTAASGRTIGGELLADDCRRNIAYRSRKLVKHHRFYELAQSGKRQ